MLKPDSLSRRLLGFIQSRAYLRLHSCVLPSRVGKMRWCRVGIGAPYVLTWRN